MNFPLFIGAEPIVFKSSPITSLKTKTEPWALILLASFPPFICEIDFLTLFKALISIPLDNSAFDIFEKSSKFYPSIGFSIIAEAPPESKNIK